MKHAVKILILALVAIGAWGQSKPKTKLPCIEGHRLNTGERVGKDFYPVVYDCYEGKWVDVTEEFWPSTTAQVAYRLREAADQIAALQQLTLAQSSHIAALEKRLAVLEADKRDQIERTRQMFRDLRTLEKGTPEQKKAIDDQTKKEREEFYRRLDEIDRKASQKKEQRPK